MKKSSPLLMLILCAAAATAQNWKWVRGTDTSGTPGNYGTQGVAAATNDPGGRHGCATWTDKAGNLWLFGGEGYANGTALSWLNDLWKYDKVTNQWTWMRGSNGPNSAGSYGTMGVASNSNDPSAREFSMCWTDTAGKFWLFGGDAYDPASGTNPAALRAGDLWKYDPSTNQWTWMKGYNTLDQYGVYNTMGTPNNSSLPGCRAGGASWVDANNRFWIFGGRGFGASGSLGYLNDIWRYDPSTNQWTWVNGSNAILQLSSYGTQSVTASTNHPSGRGFTGAWLAKTGDVFIFGGIGYVLNSTGTATVQNRLGDLWKYEPATNNWTWMSGFNVGNQPGNYGTPGQPSSSVLPGSRGFGPACWVDALGKLWMFGANGYPGQGNIGQLNDLCYYNVSTGLWTFYKGDTLANKPGIYGTKGVFASTNKPGGREYNTYWKNTGSDLWLFGGEGWDKDTTGVINHMNDLWLFSSPCNPDSVSSISGHTLCNGSSATLSIIPPDNSAIGWYSSPTSTTALGTASTFVTPTLSANTYTYYVGVATCSQTPRTAVVLTVSPPPQVNIVLPSPACAGVTMTFVASGASTYTWYNGPQSAVMTMSVPAGNYPVSVAGTDSNGCISSAFSTVAVNPNPTIAVSGPVTACGGSAVTLTVSGANSYTWSNLSTGSTCYAIVGPFPSVIFIDVVGEDSNGCQSNSSYTVTSIPSPTLNIKVSAAVVCNNNPATFTASGASTYSWSTGHTTSVMTHTATAYKTYTFTVTGKGANGCSTTDTVSYIRSECIGITEYQGAPGLLVYPNPSEGAFVIEMPANSANGTITILNNLGQLLWTKYVDGEKNKCEVSLPAGVYHCTLTSKDGQIYQTKLIVH